MSYRWKYGWKNIMFDQDSSIYVVLVDSNCNFIGLIYLYILIKLYFNNLN